MDTKGRKRKQIWKSCYGQAEHRVVAVLLAAVLVLGNICVPEGTGLSVRAAETREIEKGVENAVPAQESVQEAQDLHMGTVDDAEDDIAHGSYENIRWRIDANGKLIVTGTGEFSAASGMERAPWYSQRNQVTSAEIHVSGITDASYMLFWCKNMTEVDLSDFDTSQVTNMAGIFSNCESLASLDVSGFDTSQVTDMSAMFCACWNLTSLDVSGFDTSQVTDMSDMFGGCGVTSLDLSGFDTSQVTNMAWMLGCGVTSLDVSSLDTSQVTDMSYMFSGCVVTNLDVSGLDTSRVTDMSYMFDFCESLTSLDVSGFDTSQVTDMSGMFSACESLTSLDLSGFDTSQVTDMSDMFSACESLTSLDLSGFDTSKATDYSGMFWGCERLTNLKLDLSMSGAQSYDPKNMSYMFAGCSSLASLDLSGFNTRSTYNMSYMFQNCSSLTSLDVSGFNTRFAEDMSYMFAGCSGLTSLDVSGFHTSAAKNMAGMFYGCSGLTSLDLSGFDTSSVTNMGSTYNNGDGDQGGGMFEGCSGLTSLDLSHFNTGNVYYMKRMFAGCSGLTSLDLSSFDLSRVKEMNGMFDSCSGLTTLYTPYNLQQLSSEKQASLPCSAETDVWYDVAGTVCQSLPVGLDYSILLSRNKIPEAMQPVLTARLAKSVYALGSVIPSEDLTVKYRSADGRVVILSPANADGTDGYTLGAVDMTTSGEKVLEVLYNDGTDTLSTKVSFTVVMTVELTDEMVTLPEAEYRYNGKAHRPVPVVSLPAEEGTIILTEGKDYIVSYRWNVNAGEATVTISGQNGFRGTINKKFTIEKAAAQTLDVTFSEFYWMSQKDQSRDLSTLLDDKVKGCGSITGYTIGEITEYDTVENGGGNIFSALPVVDETGMLTYSTNAGAVGDTVLIPVSVSFAKNYEDALLCVTVGLRDRISASLSGISIQNAIYTGIPVVPIGTASVRTEEKWEGIAAGTDITDSVELVYHYGGTQADSAAYDSATPPVHAGSYVLKVDIVESDSIYKGSEEYPFVISKAPLTVTAADVELTIGSFTDLPDESTLKYEVAGFCGTHTPQDVFSTMPSVTYGLNGKPVDRADIPVDKAGVYELIPSGAVLNQAVGADYDISPEDYHNGTLTLTKSGSTDPDDPDDPKDPTDPTDPDDPADTDFPDDGVFRVNAIPDQTYTGSALKPVIRVYCGSKRLVEKKDYTVTYKNNTKANDASVEKTAPTIIVTGKGNYSGKQTVTFKILPQNIADEEVSAVELFAAQNGKVQKPVPVLTYKGRKLKNKKDFTVSYPDNKAGAYQQGGTYAVTVTGTGNYTGTRNMTLTVTEKALLAKAKIIVGPQTYTGSAVLLTADDITVKVGREILVYGTDYTLTYRNNEQIGKATVVVHGAGEKYAGTKEAYFQIKGESIAKAQVTGIVDKTYSGVEQKQAIQVQLNGRSLQEGVDYTLSYAKEVNAGTASVIITGKGGYTGTVKKTYKITAYDLQADVERKLKGVPDSLTVAYTKGGAAPTLALTFNGTTLEAKKDYTVTYKNNKKPAAATDAKAPVMIIKGKGNFKGTVTIPFTIAAARLVNDQNVTITAADIAYVNKPGKYAAKPVLTDANGKKLTAGTDYEKNYVYALVQSDGTEKALTTADIVPVGSVVKVTVAGKGYYSESLSATYRITEASFAKAKISVKPKAYTGAAVTLSKDDITVTISGDPLIYGRDYTIEEESYRNNTQKGTATVTVRGLGDYGGSKNVKFKVTSRLFDSFLRFKGSLFLKSFH